MATIIPNSEVRLIKNVPFSNNYKNVIQFNNRSSQENYFKGLPNIVAENYKYVRNNGTIKVPYYRDEILEYNYLMFKNKAYGDRYFYAFITNISYINPNTSAISFELDVFQTWFMDVEFKPSYVEREHCQRWNSDGTPVINTIPEGLDYGSEYITKDFKRLYDMGDKAKIKWIVIGLALDDYDLTHVTNGTQPTEEYHWTTLGEGVPNSIQYMVFPMREYGATSNMWELNGTNTIDVITTLWYLRNCPNFVGKVATIYVTDFLPVRYSVNLSGNIGIQITTGQTGNKQIDLIPIWANLPDGTWKEINFPFIINYESDDERSTVITNSIADKYGALKNGITESKLLMYPYSYVQMTDLQGNSFTIKNEYVNGNSLTLAIRSSLDISNKVAYTIQNYLNNSQLANELYLDNGIINSQPNRLTIVDDYMAAYIQGNMNTINQNILATQQQVTLNNQIAQNTAANNIANTMISNNANLWKNASNSVGGTLASGIEGGGKLALGSSVQSLGNTASTIIGNNASMNIAENDSLLLVDNTMNRGELANQQAIAGAMAKVQDARNIADNVNLQGGNAMFNYGYRNMSIKFIYKQITQEYIDLLQDYFGKYGYKVHKVKIPNIHTRQNWNYIQTVGANIVGNIPQMFIEALEGLFNQGITIWHTTDVGNYNLPNNEI